MDKLTWFKFSPTDWIMGKIQRCPDDTQGRYMRLVCLYWNKECILSIEDAEIEIDSDHLDILTKKKIIKTDNEFIKISFLDEQMESILETSKKNSKSAKKRWNKADEVEVNGYTVVSENHATAIPKSNIAMRSHENSMPSHKDAMPNHADKIREEEIREEKKRKDNVNTASPFKFFDSLIYLGGEKQLVSDWIAVRKLKKLTNTLTAFENFKIEVSKSNKTINEVLKECVVNSWGGFKSEWINKNNVTSPTKKRVIS